MIQCQFENGNKASLRHITVDAIIINSDKSEILLVKRALHLSNPNKYALPGGFLDRDETASQAILREVLEETGYKAEIISLFRINDNPNRPQEDRQNVDFVYLVEAKEKVAEHDKEIANVQWFKLNQLPPEEEFAFDHYENIEFYLQSAKTPKHCCGRDDCFPT